MVLEAVKDMFEGENMQTQYSVLGYKIDFYFLLWLQGCNRSWWKKVKDKDIDHELDCRFIRINPDKQGFNICEAINEIHSHI